MNKSIWKPINELPPHLVGGILYEEGNEIYIGEINGSVEGKPCLYSLSSSGLDIIWDNSYIDRVCLLTDFITHIETLEERITALELKNSEEQKFYKNKLENK